MLNKFDDPSSKELRSHTAFNYLADFFIHYALAMLQPFTPFFSSLNTPARAVQASAAKLE